jgi:hypothetical protein
MNEFYNYTIMVKTSKPTGDTVTGPPRQMNRDELSVVSFDTNFVVALRVSPLCSGKWVPKTRSMTIYTHIRSHIRNMFLIWCKFCF